MLLTPGRSYTVPAEGFRRVPHTLGNLQHPRPRCVTPIVLLMRHAKADRPAGVADRDRPLTDRGRRDAAAIGHALGRIDPAPSLILTSPATRASETAQAVVMGAGWVLAPDVRESLYRGGVQGLVGVLASAEAEVTLAVGHEPTWSTTVELLTGAAVRMVTAAVAAIEYDGRPRRGSGSLLWMLTPRLVLDEPPA